ncbi:TAF5-like RNA polymerase II p300/CBP-associated factor-associated factor 65 kDa subunit 5L [Teleopsis dalmanni]|uniref:TAF5-like RNA polymerase II p300/CBP-associated factor-associated factor 65 kDa subunit 5L n=1 Tax=Teleopsis dalmanni TaxID=139649 RepID=UPI0018CF54F4|nr:TAF5-like RNA polymerase II p300/CBP-associated factor-associated factor 65 kDa subunit 5L [Teleopsis dalmanni]
MSSKKTTPTGSSSSGTKPKKSKTDFYRSSIGNYLKQKNYLGSEKFRKSEFVLTQNKNDFILQKMVEGDLSSSDSYTFSNVLCITNNYQMAEQQFGRFSQFVEAEKDEHKLELRRFYGPLICHLYIELIKARESNAAADFLKKYANLIAPVEQSDTVLNNINSSVPVESCVESTNASRNNIKFVQDVDFEKPLELQYFIKLIETLSACTTSEEILSDVDVVHFLSTKYEIHTTQNVVDALNSYLKTKGHVLILNIICMYVHINIVENEARNWTGDQLKVGFNEEDLSDDELEELTAKTITLSEDDIFKKPLPVFLKSSQSAKSATKTRETKQNRLQAVRQCLQVVKTIRKSITENQAILPEYIKIADRDKGLTSSDIDMNRCHLIAGFNSSEVNLWQMNQQTCRGKSMYRRITDRTCCWEINNCYEEEDDEIDLDIKREESTKRNLEQEKFYESKYAGNSYNQYGGIQLRGHGKGVTDVRFSRHYPLIYSASKDCTVRTWRADNYSCASVYHGHNYPIWCLDESPIDTYIATGSKDNTARLWSTERTNPLITYIGHTQDVECVAFHPNGNYIATGSCDLSVRLWCVTSGKLMRVFSDCKQAVTTVTFSPDGKMLAAAGEETKIRIFDLAAGSQICELKDHTAGVTGMVWTNNGTQFASVCRDGSFRLWDIKRLLLNQEPSTSAAASSASSNIRLQRLNYNCGRFVNIKVVQDGTICCLGT